MAANVKGDSSAENNGKVVVEKNIPMPPSRKSVEAYPWAEMLAGDSFFAAGQKQSNMSSMASVQGRKRGWKFVTRSVEGGVRVWRVK